MCLHDIEIQLSVITLFLVVDDKAHKFSLILSKKQHDVT